MEECYYSKRFIWFYYQLTKTGYFQILTKRKGQWKVIYKRKVDLDPVKYCERYKKSGCVHVDGYLCNMETCPMKNNKS